MRTLIKADALAYLARHKARLAWWKRAFHTPLVGYYGWVFSQASTLWAGVMYLLGLSPESRAAVRDVGNRFYRRNGLRHRHSRSRLLVEVFEQRILLSGNPVFDPRVEQVSYELPPSDSISQCNSKAVNKVGSNESDISRNNQTLSRDGIGLDLAVQQSADEVASIAIGHPIIQGTSQAFDDHPLRMVDTDLSKIRGQVIYLDFDGAQGVDYNGPIVLKDLTVPAFDAGHIGLAGHEPLIIDSVIDALNARFSQVGVHVTQQRPTDEPYSTVYIGGDNSAFSQYGSFFGLAEKVDVGNQDKSDAAFVFSENINSSSLRDAIESLAIVASHEIGHLVGFQHHSEDEYSISPLSEIAYEMFVNRADLNADGTKETELKELTHQWIGQQGWEFFKSQFGPSEIDIKGFVGHDANGGKDFVKEYHTQYDPIETNGVVVGLPPGSKDNRFIEGIEDQDLLFGQKQNPFGYDIPLARHFWSIDSNYVRDYDDGFLSFDSGPNIAFNLFTGGDDLVGDFNINWGNSDIGVFAGIGSYAARGQGIVATYQDSATVRVSYVHENYPVLYGPSVDHVLTLETPDDNSTESGTWPLWADDAKVTIKIDNIVHEYSVMKFDTAIENLEPYRVLRLQPDSNPG